jgi:hypothetical protein
MSLRSHPFAGVLYVLSSRIEQSMRIPANVFLKKRKAPYKCIDRLCGLVVRVLGYRSGGPGSIPGTTKKKK